jgi:hypothetical protein
LSLLILLVKEFIASFDFAYMETPYHGFPWFQLTGGCGTKWIRSIRIGSGFP